jgi:hypothetical protein
MFRLKNEKQYGIFGIYYTGHAYSSGSSIVAKHKEKIVPL